MPFQPVYRVRNEAMRITSGSAFIREIVQRALELLKLPVPDAFLGRTNWSRSRKRKAGMAK
ncbi:hypothetical protein [Bradyrhizobium sp. CCBAU 53421]|uniref:hypothetical protein n=1 Tax=Bradyrhizobium sp. CCBAU 53421 TaxID=1325120 RepID=UPI00188C81B5|nr:hypothetical protein [Bradyrhizobium sp. CCBAU 53421]QOZ32764.1 hypothetical protein XH92_14505 [Bradyrhizobium sp. CCBAU 53421]